MANSMEEALKKTFSGDERVRVLHVQEFLAGDALVPSSEKASETSRTVSHGVTLVKLFLRTTGPAPHSPSPNAGTDIGMEIWLPEPCFWNKRVRCQIQGAFMGDFRVASPQHFSIPICTDLLSGQIASELGYVGTDFPSVIAISYLLTQSKFRPRMEATQQRIWKISRIS